MRAYLCFNTMNSICTNRIAQTHLHLFSLTHTHTHTHTIAYKLSYFGLVLFVNTVCCTKRQLLVYLRDCVHERVNARLCECVCVCNISSEAHLVFGVCVACGVLSIERASLFKVFQLVPLIRFVIFSFAVFDFFFIHSHTHTHICSHRCTHTRTHDHSNGRSRSMESKNSNDNINNRSSNNYDDEEDNINQELNSSNSGKRECINI